MKKCAFCDTPCSLCPHYDIHTVELDDKNSFGWYVDKGAIQVVWSCGLKWTAFLCGWISGAKWLDALKEN